MPGKNPKPPAAIHREHLWRALLTGVARAQPDAVRALSFDRFQLIAWNALYYKKIRDSDDDAPYIDAVLKKKAPDALDIGEARSWRRRYARWLYAIGDLFPFLISLLPDPAVKSTIAETLRYFENQDGIGSQIRELLKGPLRDAMAANEHVLVIGHSMGSIIAYDALWELWHEERNSNQIDLLLTLGSPLGMRFVQKRLRGHNDGLAPRYPGNIRQWVNVATQGDLTALDPTVADDFHKMAQEGMIPAIEDVHKDVYGYYRDAEGLNVHRSYGYLVLPQVGDVIAKWLLQDGSRIEETKALQSLSTVRG